MMARFCAYIDKVFQFRQQVATLTDSRPQPVIPPPAVFATAFTMFATRRGSLNAMDKERRLHRRLRDIIGPRVPSGDTVGRVYTQLGSDGLRQVLKAVHLRIKRNKMLNNTADWVFVAVDGHEFFRQPQALLRAVLETHPHGPG